MLAVGTLGFPYIGTLQAGKEVAAVAANEEITSAVPSLLENGQLTVLEEKKVYEIIKYQTISQDKLAERLASLPETQREEVSAQIAQVSAASKQGALANMCIFPAIMLAGYIVLGLYFKSQGGYKAQELDG